MIPYPHAGFGPQHAQELARLLHAGGKDFIGRPSFEHVHATAGQLQHLGDRVLSVAAYLYNAIEYCGVTPEELLIDGVPPGSVDIIKILQQKENEPYDQYILRIAKHPKARVIKLAALIHDTIPQRLIKFAEKNKIAAGKIMIENTWAKTVLVNAGASI